MKLRFCFSLGPLYVFVDDLEGLFFVIASPSDVAISHPEFSSGYVLDPFYSIGIVVFVILNLFQDLCLL